MCTRRRLLARTQPRTVSKEFWLTGTAAWNYVAITHGFLVFANLWWLAVAPVVPSTWKGFEAVRNYRESDTLFKSREKARAMRSIWNWRKIHCGTSSNTCWKNKRGSRSRYDNLGILFWRIPMDKKLFQFPKDFVWEPQLPLINRGSLERGWQRRKHLGSFQPHTGKNW